MVWSAPPAPPARRWAPWAALALVAVACACAAAGWWYWPRPHPPIDPVALDDDLPDPPPADPGYLGPDACARCHDARVAEFKKTSHFRACRAPEPAAMAAGFAPGRNVYSAANTYARDPGLRFEMTRRGDEFFEAAVRSTPAGEERGEARIDLVYGSGGADEVYLTWHDDRLYELPVAWLNPQREWGASPYDRHGKGDYARDMTPRCVECHNTWFEHDPSTPNRYNRQTCVVGVTCERCHGPGREHVAYHQAHPDDGVGRAVVKPAELARDRLMDLCGQCHSNATKRRGPAFSYRPGEPLEEHFRTAVSRHPEEDHVANQVKYLRLSKCYQRNDTLTCVTCHDPHRPEEKSVEGGARSCLKCHQAADCAEQPRVPAGVRGDCVGCHMPQHVKINVFFHTEYDEYVPPIRRHEHRIGVYPVARQQVLLEWSRGQRDDSARPEIERLRGELVEHWLAEADNCRREYRYLAAVGALREAQRVDLTPAVRDRLKEAVADRAGLDADLALVLLRMEEQRFPEARDLLERMLRVKPDDAQAHGRLGTVLATLGQTEQAREHLRAVARFDPDDQYGEAMLGWLAYRDGKAEEAVAAYTRADEIEPYDAKINYLLGTSLARLGRWAEAADRFRLAVKIDPKHAGGYQGLAHALCRQGRAKEAVPFARRAARLTESHNADVLVTLVEAYAGAGHAAAADAAAAQALEAAQAGDPGLVPELRLRLEEVRSHAAPGP
jgi:tetratricopeptide (TPR) repeat protein